MEGWGGGESSNTPLWNHPKIILTWKEFLSLKICSAIICHTSLFYTIEKFDNLRSFKLLIYAIVLWLALIVDRTGVLRGISLTFVLKQMPNSWLVTELDHTKQFIQNTTNQEGRASECLLLLRVKETVIKMIR